MKKCLTRLLAFSVIVGISLATAGEIGITPANQTGVYKVGEEASWTIHIKDDKGPVDGVATYAIKAGGYKEIAKGSIEISQGKAVLTATGKEPGTLLLSVRYGKDRALGGAVFDWEKIQPSAEEPADFDAFWKSKIAELQAVPMQVTLEKVESGVPATVDYWKITMDNIRGTKIYGQIAKPKKSEGKLPACLQVQYAGVYGLGKGAVTNPAKSGWLAMNIIAHDIPIDQKPEFYEKLKHGSLRSYPAQGNDDRETSYFLRMYLSCYRAVEYLSQRDDWDGKTLLVTGTSQGGLQSVMIAGLNPKVTALAANVPAGCDHTGDLVGRASGWPKWIRSVKNKDQNKVIEASKYYDVVNFARRIKCPALIGVGLIDTTCPPAGVMAAFNQIPCPEKRLIILPISGHRNVKGSQTPFYGTASKWRLALRTGKPLELGR